MKTSRVYETPTYHSFLQLPTKKSLPGRYSSASKNPQNLHQSMKLPMIPNNKSSVSIVSQRNTKNKLKNLGDKLQQLQADVHNSRMDGNETLNKMRYLKQKLLDNQLKRDRQDMTKQIQGLRNLLAATKVSNQDRSNNLRENYIQLWNQTETLKEQLFSLTMRIDKIDQMMGMKNI